MKNNKTITKNNKSNVFSVRPKRCHLCQKMFNPEKYDEHFAICYRFEKEKVDHQTQSIKKQRIKVRKTPIREIINKGNAYKVIQPKGNFRIKNVPSVLFKNDNTMQQKAKQDIFNPQTEQSIRRTPKINRLKFSSQIKKEQKKLEGQQSRPSPSYKGKATQITKQQQKKIIFQRQKKIENKSNTIRKPGETQSQIQMERQEQKANQGVVVLSQFQNSQIINYRSQPHHKQQQLSNAQSQSLSSQSQLSQQNYPQVIQQVAQNHTFLSLNNQEDLPEGQDSDNDGLPSLIQLPRPSNGTNFISQLVSNTVQIISFIQRLNINDPTLDIMVEQLNHVNQIAQQVVQLNLIGNSIGITLETIFGPRIQQLQTAIISQVSIAILRSFNNRLSSQFQELIDRNPTLRNGFTKQQIEKNFKVQKSKKQGECPICLQQYPKETFVIQLQCCHTFHEDCIQNWFNSSKNCPMCRQQQKMIA